MNNDKDPSCYLKVVALVYADDTVVVCDSEAMRQAWSPLCSLPTVLSADES